MLHTARLRLRRAVMADAPALHQVMRAPAAMRYWSTPPHADLDVTMGWLARSLARDPAHSADYVIVLGDQVIGKVGGDVLPEIGMILHPDHWGKGLATEALRAVIPHIFATYPVDHLTADVDPRNAGSLAVLAGLGFVQTSTATATFLLGEQWCDSIYLTLTKDVWLQRSISA